MGIMGLALAWETRIPAVAQRERRVEEAFPRTRCRPPGGCGPEGKTRHWPRPACPADLHAYERLYSLHGARMKNLARQHSG